MIKSRINWKFLPHSSPPPESLVETIAATWFCPCILRNISLQVVSMANECVLQAIVYLVTSHIIWGGISPNISSYLAMALGSGLLSIVW